MENTKKIKIYAIAVTVLFCLAAGLATVLFINKDTENKSDEAVPVSEDTAYTAKEVTDLLEAQYEKGYDAGIKKNEEQKAQILNEIKEKMSTGTTTLELLRELYPKYLVYSDRQGYVFSDIADIKMNSFKKGDFSVSEENKVIEYVGKEKINTHKAIDVSKYQGEIDWKKVADDGVEYAFIRVGLRGYGTGEIVDDEMFEENVEGALKNNIKVGVYFFSEAVNEKEAIEEAEYVLEKIKDYDVELPVVIDIEEIPNDEARNEKLSKEELTKVCKAFMEKVEDEGYEAMLYGNIKCLVAMVDIEELSEYDIWYAFYNDDIYIPYEVAGWQYASDGKVNGVNTECDLNIFFKEWD